MLFDFQSFLCQCIHGCLCTYVSQLSCLSFHHGSQGLNSGNHTIQQVLLSVEYLAAIAQVSVCVCVCVCVYVCVCVCARSRAWPPLNKWDVDGLQLLQEIETNLQG